MNFQEPKLNYGPDEKYERCFNANVTCLLKI